MGGIGSGRWCWHREKTTVEECRTLGALGHVRDGLLTAAPGSGTIWWSNAVTGERTASVGFRRSTVGGGVIFVLSYTVNRRGGDLHDVVLMVTMQTTPQGRRGVRWRFTCPLVLAGCACGRRVGNLY